MENYLNNHYFLFTEEEFNNCKSRAELPCKCKHCGKTIMRKKKIIQDKIRDNSLDVFCSTKCFGEHKHSITTYHSIKCMNCGKELQISQSEYDNSNSKHFFCNTSCAATYNNSHREITEEHKKKTSKTLRNNYKKKTGFYTREEKIKAEGGVYYKYTGSQKYKIKNIRCKICGQKECIYPKICHSQHLTKKNYALENIGFDYSKLGSFEIYDEYFKIQYKLYDEYYNNFNSMNEIIEKYNLKDTHSLYNLFKFLQIKTRTVSEGLRNGMKTGRVNVSYFSEQSNYKYKHGWHTSWDGNKWYYRSSYELDYMNELDASQTNYIGESLRIPYYDTQQEKERTAFPDFYLPDDNLIVEVKSIKTYDRQNMLDKVKSYKEHGYNFKLLYEHIMYDECF